MTRIILILFGLLLFSFSVSAWNGTGTLENPYQIVTAQDLTELKNNVSGGNIYEGVYFIVKQNITVDINSFCIGSPSNPFSGIFDGNNKIITGTSLITTNYFGLFGYTSGATIQNIDLREISLNNTSVPNNYIGVIAGYSRDTKFINCKVSGTITANQYIGGICGYAFNCSLENCSSSCNITSKVSGWNAISCTGGLVGYLETSQTVNYCTATGSVSGSGGFRIGGLIGFLDGGGNLSGCIVENMTVAGNSQGSCIGGLIGSVNNNAGNSATITGCSVSNSSIISAKDSVGGLIGRIIGPHLISGCTTSVTINSGTSYIGGLIGYAMDNNITISGCHSTTDESSSKVSYCTGGLIGYLETYGTITNCFSTGTLSEGNSAGGLIGIGKNFTMNNCYSDIEMTLSNSSVPIGGLIGYLSDVKSITNCYSQGLFICVGTYDKAGGVGGLIGQISNTGINSNTEIKRCFSTVYEGYNTNDLAGCSMFGGLIGRISASISNPVNVVSCYYPGLYALRIVEKNNVGGLIGNISGLSGSVSIEGCLTSGNYISTVSGGYIGGIVGSGSGIINYSVAACDSLGSNASTYIARINSTSSTLIGNLAYRDMQVNGQPVADSDKNGNGKSWTELTDPAIYSTGMGNTWTFYPGDLQGNWRSGLNISLPYSPLQASPVRINPYINNGTINGNYNTEDIPDKIELYNYQTNTLLGEVTMDGQGNWNFASDNLYLGDYIIAKSYKTGRAVALTGAYLKESRYCGGDGTPDNPYLICDYLSLKKMRDNVNSGIDSDKYFKVISNIQIPEDVNWIPIGYNSSGISFQGSFDGNNKTIDGLRIDGASLNKDTIGFFGKLQGATIKNLILKTRGEGITVSNKRVIGTLAAFQRAGIIEKCIVWSNINATTSTGNSFIGGLVGYQSNGSLGKPVITQSYTFSFIHNNSTGNTRVGGIAGLLGGEINDSYGRVYISSYRNYAGGLAGELYSWSNYYAKITNSYVEGSVSALNTASNYYAGGIAGYLSVNSQVSNSVSILDTISNAYNDRSRTGRVIGGTAATSASNYARKSMTIDIAGNNTPAVSSATGTDGLDAEPETLRNLSFYQPVAQWNIASSGNTTDKWNIWDGYTHPYIQGQSAPVTITRSAVSVEGMFRPADSTIENDSIVIYQLKNGELRSAGRAILAGSPGTFSWTFIPSQNISDEDELFVVYYENGKLPSALIPVPSRRVDYKYYKSVQDGGWEDAIWQASVDGIDFTDSSAPVSIAPESDGIEKIMIFHTINGTNSPDNYTTKILRIESTGKLDLTTGTLTADTIEIVSIGESGSGQLKNSGCNLNAQCMKAERKFNASDGWTFYSVPYAVKKITNNKGKEMTRGNVNITNAHYYLKYYDGQQRATNKDVNYSGSGKNWIYCDLLTEMQPNTGYVLYSGNTLHFISEIPASPTESTDAVSACNYEPKTVPTEAYNSDLPEHSGWNLLGNPYTTAFNLKYISPQHVCYVYNKTNNNYDTYFNQDYRIQPFVPFFIQATGTYLNFDPEGVESRSRGTEKPFDEIGLQLSDGNYSDLFRIHFRKDATTGYDLNKDGQKLFTSETQVPQLFGSTENIRLAIQAIPHVTRTLTRIPLSCYVPQGGSYTISLASNTLPPDIQSVFLQDNAVGISTELTSETYHFTFSGKEINTSRFMLILVKKTTSGTDNIQNDPVNIHVENDQLVISGLERESEVILYEPSGRNVKTYSRVVDGQRIYPGLKGVYLVKIISASQQTVKKVILGK